MVMRICPKVCRSRASGGSSPGPVRRCQVPLASAAHLDTECKLQRDHDIRRGVALRRTAVAAADTGLLRGLAGRFIGLVELPDTSERLDIACKRAHGWPALLRPACTLPLCSPCRQCIADSHSKALAVHMSSWLNKHYIQQV